jgi:hypothetical protein
LIKATEQDFKRLVAVQVAALGHDDDISAGERDLRTSDCFRGRGFGAPPVSRPFKLTSEASAIVRLSQFDINPLLATPDRLVALDARVVLHGKDVDAAQLPRPAIRPYPRQYHRTVRLKDGSELNLRPIRPEDEPGFVKFHYTLSEHSVYMRYFHWMKLEQRT